MLQEETAVDLARNKDQRIAELEAEVKQLRTMLEHSSDHPIRVKIGLWLAQRKFGSPVEFHRDHPDIPLGNVSYHFQMMLGKQLLVLAKTTSRRGATEHYYRLTKHHPLYKTRKR